MNGIILLTGLLAGLLTGLLTTASAGAREARRASHRTSFVSRGPAPTPGTPFCDAEQHCVFPGTRTATYEGDWVGTGIAAGGVAIGENAHFAGAPLWLFVGTIRNCGTGTLVYAVLETGDLAAMSGKGTWRIMEGFGTGDLADVTGNGTGAGSVAEGSRYKGVIRCPQK
ncbi:MAG TPA: hypothetical protein VEM59_09375 [Acidimicrobiia bacterium]|nr:hypothetical protein [Acidimicrobiia bacterium]